MEYKTVLIFGGTGALGSAIGKYFNGNTVIYVDSNKVDFTDSILRHTLNEIISQADPDIIVNCAGVIDSIDHGYDDVFNINVRSNWQIMTHFKIIPPVKPVIFQMIGSSAYNGPRKDYPLYAASKAAVNSLYLSGNEIFEDTSLHLMCTHPPKLAGGLGGDGGQPIDTVARNIYMDIVAYYKSITALESNNG